MEHPLLPLNSQYAAMPWDKIDQVVFDVGNVLLSFHPKRILAELFPGEDEKQMLLYPCIFLSPCWTMLDRGLLTNDEAARAMAGPKGMLLAEIRYLLDNWVDLKDIVPEGVETLKRCKEQGKRCYVLSNYHTGAFQHVREKYEFFNLFDGFVISAEIHLLKPEAAIFHYLLDRFRLNGTRTLFLDDSPLNVEGALHCGIQAIAFTAPGTLQSFFA